MQNFLLYQAYGKKEVKLECKFALLDLLRKGFNKNLCAVIYTDDVSIFEKILEQFEFKKIICINQTQIEKWRGPINFVHRVKIKILMDFLENHEGNLLYCDTDTYFLESPDKIFSDLNDGEFYMHTLEGKIDKKTDPQFRKWQKFLSDHLDIIGITDKQKIRGIEMWNAGVIGLNSKNKFLLNAVLDLTDKVYALFPKHIAEQFAFSYIFQSNHKISPASAHIFHYWYLKEFAPFIERVFDEHKDENQLSQLSKITRYPEEILKDKLDYESKNTLIRLMRGKWKL